MSHGSIAPTARTEHEASIRLACEAGDFATAATRVIDGYGGEILGFLTARARATGDAHEVFSMFLEDLWTALPAFRWQCTMRGYCYTLARNAANRWVVAPANRAGRHAGLSAIAGLSQAVERVRSRTAPYLRTEVKGRMQALREELPEVEQTLLILRVDRGLSFRDIALVLAGGGDELDDATLVREGARWRKRFQLVKEALRKRALAEGLLEG